MPGATTGRPTAPSADLAPAHPQGRVKALSGGPTAGDALTKTMEHEHNQLSREATAQTTRHNKVPIMPSRLEVFSLARDESS